MQVIIRSLQTLSKAFSKLKRLLVQKVTQSRRREIFVIVEAGVVHEIINLPPHLHLTVIDYDVESVDESRLQISPVDGELCFIHKW